MSTLVILAAGESARLGQPKQLLILDDKPLLEHIIDAGLSSDCSQIVVVLGANYATIYDAVMHKPVKFIQNPDWQSGMGSSIRVAMQHLNANTKAPESIILATCDQPFLSTEVLNQLICGASQPVNIVASKYADTFGVPALFKPELFSELSSLGGTQGARKIIQENIQKNIAKVATVDFPEGAIDIDTEADWQDFKSGRHALRSSSM